MMYKTIGKNEGFQQAMQAPNGQVKRQLPPDLLGDLEELASTFSASIPESLNTIEMLLKDESPTMYERAGEAISIAHQIKGSAGTLGLTTVSQAFAVLEAQLKLIKEKKLFEDVTARATLNMALELCRTIIGGRPDQVLLAHPIEDKVPDCRILTVDSRPEEVDRFKEGPGQLVLLIEDDPVFINIIQSVIGTDEHFKRGLMSAKTLTEAVQLLLENEPDIILLDLALPDSEGIETFHKIHKLAPDIPILILTALDDTPLADESVACGAQDYLVKGRISPDALTRCIRYSITRFRAEQSMMRLRAIEDFNGALAHDLRVPVQGADRILELMLTGHFGELPKDLEHALKVMDDSNKELLNRLTKLINLYKVEFGEVNLEWQPTSVATLLESVLAVRIPQIEKRQLTVNVEQNDLEVFTDPFMLFEVLDELVNNAIKFATDGDTITIGFDRNGDRAAIKVSNPGQYITKDEKRNLFKKFWRGSPGKTYVATSGLGLYYCQQIMNVLEGSISCRSNPSLTTFTVRVPAVSIDAGDD